MAETPVLSKEDVNVLLKYREIMSRPDVAAMAKDVCTTSRANGSLDGICASNGGRVWLEGEWQLCELDALCQHIRQHVLLEACVPDDFIDWLIEGQPKKDDIDED